MTALNIIMYFKRKTLLILLMLLFQISMVYSIGFGKLKVVTSPYGAEVYIDGDLIGKSPIETELMSEKYKLKIVKDGYDDYVETIEITTDKTKTINIKLTSINRPATETQYKPKGKTVQEKETKKAFVSDGKGLFIFNSTPSYATVYVDGLKLPNKTPCQQRFFPGNHDIRFEKDGYQDFKVIKYLAKDITVNVTGTLNQKITQTQTTVQSNNSYTPSYSRDFTDGDYGDEMVGFAYSRRWHSPKMNLVKFEHHDYSASSYDIVLTDVTGGDGGFFDLFTNGMSGWNIAISAMIENVYMSWGFGTLSREFSKTDEKTLYSHYLNSYYRYDVRVTSVSFYEMDYTIAYCFLEGHRFVPYIGGGINLGWYSLNAEWNYLKNDGSYYNQDWEEAKYKGNGFLSLYSQIGLMSQIYDMFFCDIFIRKPLTGDNRGWIISFAPTLLFE